MKIRLRQQWLLAEIHVRYNAGLACCNSTTGEIGMVKMPITQEWVRVSICLGRSIVKTNGADVQGRYCLHDVPELLRDILA